MEQVILFVHDQRETVGEKLVAITEAFGPGAAKKVKNIRDNLDLWEFRLLNKDNPIGLNDGIDFDVSSMAEGHVYFEVFDEKGRLVNSGSVGRDKAMYHLERGSHVKFYGKVTIYHADQD